MRRSFPKMYRTDPSTISSEQLHRLFIEILEAGVVVPFSHPFRKYLLNVVDVSDLLSCVLLHSLFKTASKRDIDLVNVVLLRYDAPNTIFL